jgi:hypothetical protein
MPMRHRGGLVYLFSTSAVEGVGGQYCAPAALHTGKYSFTNFREFLLHPRADLDAYGERKISSPQLGSNPGSSNRKWDTISTTLSAPPNK